MKRALLISIVAVLAGAAQAAAQPPASGQEPDGVRTPGLGLYWAHQQIGGAQNDERPGGVSLRYWFNKRWGADAGVGMGFPVVGPNSSFLVNFKAEAMRAIKRSGPSVLYADLLAMPAVARLNGGLVNNVYYDNGQNGTAFVDSVSAGLGFESALWKLPRLRWFAEFNPLSYERDSPAPGSVVRPSSAFDFLGSNTVVAMGFHYLL